MDLIADSSGGLLILAGTLLYLWRNKRIFDRTNSAGIQQYSSYSGKLAARLGDTGLWFAAVLIVMAGGFVLAEVHQETWGRYVYGAVFFWLLVGVFLIKPK